ncbi:MAG TPA: energy transducer TonB [Steroidobacteraceae bacterium]|nr:energy transducer TonB [Steroidobacteraceae bacterium]
MPVRRWLPPTLVFLSSAATSALAQQSQSSAFVDLKSELSATLEDCSRKRRAAVDTRPPHITKFPAADTYYPQSDQSQGYQGIVLVEFMVDAAGNPRFAHAARVLSNSGQGDFASAAVDYVHDSRFAAGEVAGVPTSAWWQLKVKFTLGLNPMGNLLTEDKLRQTMKAAAQGDLKAIETVSYLHSIAASEVALTTTEEFNYLAESAQNGERSAALRVAQLLSASACVKPPRVQEMLKTQAMQGYSAAEMVLAGQLMEANDPATYDEIAPLLHGAANSVDPFVALWATGLLATAPVDALRDPAAALTHASQFKDSDPDTRETLAAIQAANGHFDQAIKLEQAAISKASSWRWKLDELQKRLATYQSGKPWTGYLCDCQQLVPGEGI